ncbi:hypothetical protein E2986_01688 [Frieseomelitta varia]|uniref:Uncharacterized protein n=1 Tax=Frieseomelitta varia TaxID=561572 RepID=A0A833SC44_9HYME|nr:hypothetical protein E2986_01688 [Frieseomelitta varia]
MELRKEEAQICRLCGQYESIYIDVFGEEGTKRFLGLKIHTKINILIDERDPLPKAICVQCLGKLEFVCDFQEECLRTQQVLRDRYNLPPLTEIAEVKTEDTPSAPSTSTNDSNNETNNNLNSSTDEKIKEVEQRVLKTATKVQRNLRSQQQIKGNEEGTNDQNSVQSTTEDNIENVQIVQNSETTPTRWLRSRQSTETIVINDATIDIPIANRLRSHDNTATEITVSPCNNSNENGDNLVEKQEDPHTIQIPTSALNKLLSIVSNSPNIEVSVKETRNQTSDIEDISFTVELCKKESDDIATVRARVFPDQGSCLVDKAIVGLLQNQSCEEVNSIINTIINSSLKNGSSTKLKDSAEFEQKWQASQNPEELFRIDGEEIRVDDNVEHIVTDNQNGYSCKLCCKFYERKDKCMVINDVMTSPSQIDVEQVIDTPSNIDFTKSNEAHIVIHKSPEIKSNNECMEKPGNCLNNTEDCSVKSKAILASKEEKGEAENTSSLKQNENLMRNESLLAEESEKTEDSKTNLITVHDNNSDIEIISVHNNQQSEIFTEQNRIAVIKSSSNKVSNPKTMQEDCTEVCIGIDESINENIKNEECNILNEHSLSRHNQNSFSGTQSKNRPFGKISKLISDEQKQIIETYYVVNMSVINSEEVQRNITVADQKKIRCNICGNLYLRMDKCQVHIWGHLQMKPYQCKACDFATVTVSNVRCHIRKCHLKLRPFECHLCEKRYVTAILLEEHINTHTGARPYKCELCDFAGSSRQTLSYHRATHKLLKVHAAAKYKCTLCPNVYKSSQILKEHLLKHEGIRKYKCNVCEKSFGQQSHLAAHMAVHSKIRFHCPGCSKPFNRLDNMKMHTKRCKPFLANPDLKRLLNSRERTISFDNVTELTAELKTGNITNSVSPVSLQNQNGDISVKTEEETVLNLCKLEQNISLIESTDKACNSDKNYGKEVTKSTDIDVVKIAITNDRLIPENENLPVFENILGPENY